MPASKSVRLGEIFRRLRAAAPFRDGDHARLALETIMRQVEDEMSGIPENPDAIDAPPDGRMYPPHDAFERLSDNPRIRVFRQAGHKTSFGDNGSILITDAKGNEALSLSGIDGVCVSEILEV